MGVAHGEARCVRLVLFLLLWCGTAAADPLLDQVGDRVGRFFYRPDRLAAFRAARPTGAGDGEKVNRWLATLGASHTAFYLPDSKGYYELGAVFGRSKAYRGIGIDTLTTSEGCFARAVWPGFPADQSGVRVGDRLVAVDGRPYSEIASFRSRHKVQLTVQRTPDPGSRETVWVITERIEPGAAFERILRSSVKVVERGAGRWGYVQVWSYAGERYQKALEEVLADEPLRSCDGLVLDIRDGWGGAQPRYLNLFNPKVPKLVMTGRDGKQVEFDSQWRKPVALLVDRRSRSGKEILAYGFRKHHLGAVVGERTAGAVLAGRLFPLRGGLLYLAVADAEADGERLEGVGVEPDIAVARPIPYCNGADPQREAAVDWLASRKLP